MHYILLFVVVMLLDLIPAFAPPAWIVAVFFRHRYHLEFTAVVILAALAATVGRFLLATLTRKLKRYIPKRYRDNLEYSKQLLARNRQKSRLAVGLFLFSPLPSAQLFEAAGLLDVSLFPLSAAFLLGRLATLSLYLLFAHLTITNFGKLLEGGLSSPWVVIFEVLSILLIVTLFKMPLAVQTFNKGRQRKTK